MDGPDAQRFSTPNQWPPTSLSFDLGDHGIGHLCTTRHIVRYCGTDRGIRHLYIFLEYVPGGSIASMLQQFGVFREDLVRRFMHQILLGTRYLHDKGIIHRDIKGANVLVTEQVGTKEVEDAGSKSV